MMDCKGKSTSNIYERHGTTRRRYRCRTRLGRPHRQLRYSHVGISFGISTFALCLSWGPCVTPHSSIILFYLSFGMAGPGLKLFVQLRNCLGTFRISTALSPSTNRTEQRHCSLPLNLDLAQPQRGIHCGVCQYIEEHISNNED